MWDSSKNSSPYENWTQADLEQLDAFRGISVRPALVQGSVDDLLWRRLRRMCSR